jgi:hypothetical protein
VADEVILNDLKNLSKGELNTSPEFVFENTTEILARNNFKKKKHQGGGRQKQRNRKRN